MINMNKKGIGAIILAAGKGKRMKSKSENKVVLPLADKPMIVHTIQLLTKMKVSKIVVVVGFAKDSVIELLEGKVIFAEQKKRLGTAHAVYQAVKKIPNDIKDVLVLNGDDSAFYSRDLIEKLVKKHVLSNSSFTFLTIDQKEPFGLGRVVRGNSGIEAVVEEKDATAKQKKIREVNPGCYIFKVSFLKKYLPQVQKSKITNEYYLTSLIDIGIKNNEKIETLQAGNIAWRGVNTRDELKAAERLFLEVKE